MPSARAAGGPKRLTGGYFVVAGWNYRLQKFKKGHLVPTKSMGIFLPDDAKTLCGAPMPTRKEPRSVKCRNHAYVRVEYGDVCARCFSVLPTGVPGAEEG